MTPVSVYVHIPFCVSKCDYCDFTSFPFIAGKECVDTYFNTLCIEFEFWQKKYTDDFKIETLYIGGGTPSMIEPSCYKRLFSLLKPFLSSKCEFTCEVNPGSVDANFLLHMKEWGCNRISMGLQSPSNGTLVMVNRNQTIENFLESYSIIKKFYENVNIDLICGLPESLEDWSHKSRKILSAIQPEHVSVYILEAEKATPLSTKYDKGEIVLPSMHYSTAVFEDFAWFLQSQGYNRYEISNFSKSGRESRHNKVYWNYGQYIGIGVSAGGHVGNLRYVNTPVLKDYIDFKSKSRYEYIEEKTIVGDLREMVFMGLRYRNGFSKKTLYDRLLKDFDERVYKNLDTFILITGAVKYFVTENDKIRLNDYYFVHNREAFEFFIEVFEQVFL